MALALSIPERMARARSDLRAGVPVILSCGRQHALAIATETLNATRLDDFRKIGAPVLALTRRRAETLKARCYDGDVARIPVPADMSIKWAKGLADPSDDLHQPMKGPLTTIRNGNPTLYRAAINLTKQARLLPSALLVEIPDDRVLAELPDLTSIEIDPAQPGPALLSPLHRIVSAHVPLAVSKAGRLHVFRPEDGGEEHYAIEIGKPDRNRAVLARLHSACFTGDLLGSLKCDCGPQLHGAMQQMGKEGAGILLYLNQEGRGIGLANKMRAYSLQDQGLDTVEANHRLGFEDDERDFRIGAHILQAMGFSAVRLLTNNPAKIEMMKASGIDVTERVPLVVGKNPLNAGYLDTKARKSGHIL